MKHFVFILFLLFSLRLYAAEEFQDLSIVSQKAHDFLQDKLKAGPDERITFTLGSFDDRLRLPKCDPASLFVFIPNDENPVAAKTIGVSCRSVQAWTVYLTSKVNVFVKLAVATQNIAHDELLTPKNVVLSEKDRNGLATGYFTSLIPIERTVAKRIIMAGSVITPDMIRTETVVQRGDAVQIKASSPYFSVEMSGVAMSSGGIGDRVYVLNPSSKRTIEARVTGTGKVDAVL